MAMNLSEWHYRVRPARIGGGYVAWAATTPELGQAPTDVARNRVVLFLFDDSEEEALDRLKLAIAGEAHEVELRAARRRHSAAAQSQHENKVNEPGDESEATARFADDARQHARAKLLPCSSLFRGT